MRGKIALVLATAFLLILPVSASAHEHRTYEIGDRTYEFTVGSINEPIAVDDRTGVDLRVVEVAGTGAHGLEEDDEGVPVEGLEQTLQVEIKAGDKSRVLSLSPAFRDPGRYRAHFIPTIQTTYTYRFFGTINGVEVDLSFECLPEGHARAEENTERVTVSGGVTRVRLSGVYGCPDAKSDLGFPEPAVTQVEASTQIAGVHSQAGKVQALAIVALVLGGLSLAVSAKDFLKRK